jgi:predicted metalloprotease with PDZ domain
MLYKTLRERGSGKKDDVGSFEETIAVYITRIFLGENGNGLKCTYNEPNLSHDFGVRLREGEGGEAIVVEVISESTAERAGVKIGDILSVSLTLVIIFVFHFSCTNSLSDQSHRLP